jgi:aminopeptidase N
MQEPLTLTFQKHSFRSIFHPSNHPNISGQTTLAIFDRSFLAVAKGDRKNVAQDEKHSHG